MESKKIGLVGLLFENNLGDPLMIECVEYIYNKISQEKKINLDYEYIDLFGRESSTGDSGVIDLNIKQSLSTFFLRSVSFLTRNTFPKIERKIQNQRFFANPNGYFRLKKYYKEKLKDVDMIVVVGGALVKYKLIRDFHNPMHTLIETAEELGINVYFNAVGIENGYNSKDQSCNIVEDYLNSTSIKLITTRDDINTLEKYIKHEAVQFGQTADTAVWVDEIFSIDTNIKSDTVGIGLIEPKRFVQYSQGITEEAYEEWIKQLLLLLSQREIKWKLFTNGHIEDYTFGEKIVKELNLDPTVLVQRPVNYFELMDTINSFNSIVVSRLHACIIGYGLNKPVIGIDWNDKVIFFGRAIGYPERFFKPKEKAPIEVVELLENLDYINPYEEQFRNLYRKTILNYIEKSFDYL